LGTMRSGVMFTSLIVLAMMLSNGHAVPTSKWFGRVPAKKPAAAPVTPPAAAAVAPELAGSFHTAYWISAIFPKIPHLPGVSQWISKVAELLEGECWQNIDPATGLITIKTVTRPTLIGSLIVPSTTSVWIKDHGWTFDAKHDKCSVDTVNSQLVIPGSILKSSGVYKGRQTMQPMVRVTDPKPSNKDGSYNVDVWDATLPGKEGAVTYFLLSDAKTPTPLMSHYSLTGKPPVWAQYKFFVPGENAESNYVDPCPASTAPPAATPHH